MKFDVIIINPPYKRGMHASIFNKSFEQLNNGGTIMCIHPSTYFLNGKEASSDEVQKLKDIVSNYKSTLNLFDGNSIFDIKQETPLSITTVKKIKDKSIKVINNHIKNGNTLVYNDINKIYIHGNDIVLSILDRIKSKMSISLNQRLFREGFISNYYLEINKIATGIPKNGNPSGKWQCLISKKYETHFSDMITTKPCGKGDKGGIVNEVGFHSMKELKNGHSYLTTKFARFCLSLRKTGRDLNSTDLIYVPYLDFSQEWTDEKLFEHFELEPDEREFINNYIQNWYEGDTTNMKFDVVLGNPPYQIDTGGVRNKNIWQKFVKVSFDVCKRNGYVSLIHPPHWRDVGGDFVETKKFLFSKNIKYINMNDVNEGLRTFKVTQPFDWYVIQNNEEKSVIKINDIYINESTINIDNFEFIPNGSVGLIESLLAKRDEESVEIMHSYSYYDNRKRWMLNEKTDTHTLECVRYVYNNGDVDCYYSCEDKGHFGISKVMVGAMADVGNIIVDLNGRYGMSPYVFGIVDEPENLPLIKKALEDDRFHKLMDDCRFSRMMFNRRVISLFRKDFWKEFI